MANVKIELDSAGVRELLRSEEMKTICEEYANNAVSKLGDGYAVTAMIGKNRANASVIATTYKAIQENLEDNRVLKALR